jgi:hypothetical protein
LVILIHKKTPAITADQETPDMNTAVKIASFYWQGFGSMQTGRTLWQIIIIKFIIIFDFLKLAFYPNLLNSAFETDAQKAAYVLENITISVEKNNGTGL